MLDGNAPRVKTVQVTQQLFIRKIGGIGVFFQNIQKRVRFFLQTAVLQFDSVFTGVFAEKKFSSPRTLFRVGFERGFFSFEKRFFNARYFQKMNCRGDVFVLYDFLFNIHFFYLFIESISYERHSFKDDERLFRAPLCE